MSNHDRNVKLTLQDLVAKKAEKQAARNWSEDVYIASLGGEITVQNPGEKMIYKSIDMTGETIEDAVYANAFLVYHSVKLFQDPSLHEAYEVKDNIDIVKQLLTLTEINETAGLILEKAGFAEPDQVKDKAKNS